MNSHHNTPASSSCEKIQILRNFTSREEPPIVVVGGGISGPCVALGAIDKGYTVIMLRKHPYAIRRQRVLVRNDSLEVFKKFSTETYHDEKFFNKVKRNSYKTQSFLSIASIERYLTHKLKRAESDGKILIIDENSGELTDINITDKTVAITDNSSLVTHIPFTHVIDATGTKRHVFKLMNNRNSDKLKDSYEVNHDLKSIHLANGTAIFNISELMDEKKLANIRQKILVSDKIGRVTLSTDDLLKLRNEFIWDEGYSPKANVIINDKVTKFYIVSEIPSYILQLDPAKKKSAVIEYMRFLLKIYIKSVMNEEMEDKYLIMQNTNIIRNEAESEENIIHYMNKFGFDRDVAISSLNKKYDLQTTAFKIKMSSLSQAIYDIDGNGQHVVAAVGDALLSPYVYYASGINRAIETAELFLNLLQSRHGSIGFDVYEYTRYTSDLKGSYLNAINFAISEYNEKLSDCPTKTIHPIHIAAKNGNIEAVKIFIRENPSLINEVDRYNQTPFLWAAVKGHIQIIEYLLEINNKLGLGLDMDKPTQSKTENNGKSPLHWALEMGHFDVAKRLIESGCNTNITIDHDGKKVSVTQYAWLKGIWDILKLLIATTPDAIFTINSSGKTLLMFAAENGDIELLEHLFEHGAVQILLTKMCHDDGNNTSDYTALHFAVKQGHHDIVNVLLEYLSYLENVERSEQADNDMPICLIDKPVDIPSQFDMNMQIKLMMLNHRILLKNINSKIGGIDEVQSNIKTEMNIIHLLITLCEEYVRLIQNEYWVTQRKQFPTFFKDKNKYLVPNGIQILRDEIDKLGDLWKYNVEAACHLLLQLNIHAKSILLKPNKHRTLNTTSLYTFLANLSIVDGETIKLNSVSMVIEELNQFYVYIEDKIQLNDVDTYLGESDSYRRYRYGYSKDCDFETGTFYLI